MSSQYTEYALATVNRKFSWAGIFSGTFLFLAIETTFGVLGAAIFASTGNASSTNGAGPSIGVGIGIWMVVLSIIALYFGGKLASTYSAAATRNAGMYAGLVTYGMSIVAALLVAALASRGGVPATNFVLLGGYWLFAAMVLGGIAAAFGGIHGAITSGLRTMERAAETKRVA